VKRGLILLLALGLAACEPAVDRGQCLQQHTDIILMPQMMVCGPSCITTLLLPMPVTSCVRWEFPEGRPHDDVHVQAPAP
jgi:hypothetical protein